MNENSDSTALRSSHPPTPLQRHENPLGATTPGDDTLNPFATAIRPLARTTAGAFVVLFGLTIVLAGAVGGAPTGGAWPEWISFGIVAIFGVMAVQVATRQLLSPPGRGHAASTITVLSAADRHSITLSLLPGLAAAFAAAVVGIVLRLLGFVSPLEHMLVLGLLLASAAFAALHAYISVRLRSHVNETLNGIDVQSLDRLPPAMLSIGSQLLIASLSITMLAATYFGLLSFRFLGGETTWAVPRVLLGVATLMTFGIASALAFQMQFKATVSRLHRLLRYLREGRLRTRAPFLGLGDLGALGLELTRLHGDIGRYCAHMYRISQGDLTSTIDERGALPSAIRALTNFLRDITEEMQMAIQELNAAAVTVLHTAVNFETNAYEHATAARESGQTIEGLWEASREISRESQSMRRIADDVASGIERTAEQINALIEHQVQIEEILDTVREIAERSDILALNASLEGVRAGEAGRGFSLVAAEMRRMAEKVKAAANDIRDIVNGVRASARLTIESTESGRRMGETLTKTAQRIMMIANQQQTSTGQVTRHMQEIGDYLQTTAGETAVASTTAQALADLTHQAEALIDRLIVPTERPPKVASGQFRSRSTSSPREAPFHHDSADLKALAMASTAASTAAAASSDTPADPPPMIMMNSDDVVPSTDASSASSRPSARFPAIATGIGESGGPDSPVTTMTPDERVEAEPSAEPFGNSFELRAAAAATRSLLRPTPADDTPPSLDTPSTQAPSSPSSSPPSASPTTAPAPANVAPTGTPPTNAANFPSVPPIPLHMPPTAPSTRLRPSSGVQPPSPPSPPPDGGGDG